MLNEKGLNVQGILIQGQMNCIIDAFTVVIIYAK